MGETERRGGFELAFIDGLNGRADDLREVGRDVQRERDPSGQKAALNIERRNELRQRVIEEKQLHQKRRAAEEEDVRAAHGAEYGVFGDLAEGKKYGEHKCRQHGGDGKRKRYAGGLEQRRHPADDLLNGVHGDILSDINGARDLKTGPPAEISFYVITLMRPSL